ncbi:uncharacterized protein LOC134196565 [Corticium candelabrum]|uniref:uncharacterized protein LOC134196565 n=1 Tax=Corticium candelabrum TaxID=121492 RepID=UPI002E25C99E|nr:uncharacterized protein LOC134196565 [Corticium candelabrum]
MNGKNVQQREGGIMWTSLARLDFTMETKQRRSYNKSETSSLQLETPKFKQNTDQYWSIRDKTNRDEDQRAHKNSKNHFDVPSRCLLSEQEYATTADQGRLKQTSYQMFDTQMKLSQLRVDFLEKEDQKKRKQREGGIMWTSLARLYFTMETKQRRSYNRSETSSLQLETPKFEQNTDQYWSIRDKTNRDEDQRAHKNSKNHFDIPSRCLLSEQEYATTADQGRLKQTSYQMFDTQMKLSQLRVDFLEKEDQKWSQKVQEQMMELLEIWTRRYGCREAISKIRLQLQQFEVQDDFLPWLKLSTSHKPSSFN